MYKRLAAVALLCVSVGLAGCKDATLEPELVGGLQGTILDYETSEPLAGVSVTTSPPTEALVTGECLGQVASQTPENLLCVEEVVPEEVEDYPAGHVPQDFDDLPNDLTHEDVPVSPKYFEGFRSLGSEVSTKKSDDEPAWLQDMANTTERAGRAQDKEDLMERLRDLGYM